MFLLERKGTSDTDSGPSEEFTVLGVTNNGELHSAECIQHLRLSFLLFRLACPHSHVVPLHDIRGLLYHGLDLRHKRL